MSTERELELTDYVFDTGLVFQEMRALIEGVIYLSAEEASPLLTLARSHDQYALAEIFSTIDTSLSRLRDLIRSLQAAYIEEIKRQVAAESP